MRGEAGRETEGKDRLTEWWPWPSQIVLSVKGSTGLLGLWTGGHTYANAAVDPCLRPGRLDAYLKGFKFTAKGVRRTASDCHGPNKSVFPVVFLCPLLSASPWAFECTVVLKYNIYTLQFILTRIRRIARPAVMLGRSFLWHFIDMSCKYDTHTHTFTHDILFTPPTLAFVCVLHVPQSQTKTANDLQLTPNPKQHKSMPAVHSISSTQAVWWASWGPSILLAISGCCRFD